MRGSLSTIPHYDLVITDNNTDVFVLVIGESARTDVNDG